MKTLWLSTPLTIACFFSTVAHSRFVDGVRAVVQDRAILHSDVTERFVAIKKSPTLASILKVNSSTFTEEAALNQLIEEKIVLSAAKDLGAEPSESEVSKQVATLASSNGLSVDGLRKSLSAENISFDLYKQNIQVQLAKRTIIEREIRSSSTGLTDQELKNYYEQNAPEEFLVSLIRGPKGKQGTTTLLKLKKRLDSSSKDIENTLTKAGAIDLGWNSVESLSEAFQQALNNRGGSKSTSVFTLKGRPHLLVVRASRKGSTDNFENVKEQLRMQLQAKDSETRFTSWIEQKKRSMNILVNKQ